MKTPFETEALRKAEAALKECIERLKPLQCSVSTDYAVGQAIHRVENALADIEAETRIEA